MQSRLRCTHIPKRSLVETSREEMHLIARRLGAVVVLALLNDSPANGSTMGSWLMVPTPETFTWKNPKQGLLWIKALKYDENN